MDYQALLREKSLNRYEIMAVMLFVPMHSYCRFESNDP